MQAIHNKFMLKYCTELCILFQDSIYDHEE